MKAALQILAVVFSVLVATLPLSSATTVNILFNGVVQKTADISPKNIANKQVTIIHEPDDLTWTRVKVKVAIDSASLEHTIERILLFKCKLLNPTDCSKTAPIDFETFADTELLWSDISEKEGPSTYPQAGQLMTLVKLKNSEGQVVWISFWDRITRTDYNLFNKFNFEQGDIDFYVTTQALVDPAKNFIENFQMLPFNWATKAVLKGTSLFAVGGNKDEIEIPKLTSAVPPGLEVTSISKDFFFVFSKTSSGISNAVTLNRNPSFTCGDGVCSSSLGESSASCCFDCSCGSGEYCDIPAASQPEGGVCKSQTAIVLNVLPPPIPPVTDCSAPISLDLQVQVVSPPSTIPATSQAIITLNKTIQTVSCTLQGSLYTCPLKIQPKNACGVGSFSVGGPNRINMTLKFSNGPNTITQALSTSFPAFPVTTTCGCPNNFFCDSSLLVCKPQSSISLSVLNVTSFLPTFNPAGDVVTLTAKINNPPSDLSVSGVQFTLGKLFKDSAFLLNQTTGSVTCTAGGGHLYTCKIPISIQNYDHAFAYFFRGNSIAFSVSFSDAGQTVTKDLPSAFSDITIPSFTCGDAVCNAGESQANCCLDCGCPLGGMFCDKNRLSCGFLNNITLSVLSLNPANLTDCLPDQPHTVELTAQVANPPSDLRLDNVFYKKAGQVQPFPLSCTAVNPGANTGLFSCLLTLPPFPQCQQQPQPFILGPNTLEFTASFANGNTGRETKTLTTNFQDISIKPIPKCGDGTCESILGESGGNCCNDCPCSLDPNYGSGFFCNIPQQSSSQPSTTPGVCLDKSSIKLVIDSPTATVSFDSCEKQQTLDIQAHIVNEPANIITTVFAATLNNTNAEFLNCKKTGPSLGGNQSAPIECKLRIPAISTCSIGKTYVYKPNSLSATLAFQSGSGGTQVVTTTTQLPTFQTTQQIRSIFDITSDAFRDISREVQETSEIVEDLLGKLEQCLKVAILLAIASIGIIIAGGVAGADEGAGWRKGVDDGVKIGAGLMGMWQSYCELISKYSQATISAQQIKIQFRQSQLCMDIVQHSMDLGVDGPCGKGQELSCFNQLVGCLNFANIQNAMSQLSGFVSQATGAVSNFGKAAELFGEGLAGFGIGGGQASLSILWNNGNAALIGGKTVCNRKATPSSSSFFTPVCPGGDTDNLNIAVTGAGSSGCEFPVVRMIVGGGTEQQVCKGSECANKVQGIDQLPTGPEKRNYILYCFPDQETWIENSNSPDISKFKAKGTSSVEICIGEDRVGNNNQPPPDCNCDDQGELLQGCPGSSQGTGTPPVPGTPPGTVTPPVPGTTPGPGTVTLKPSSATIASGETVVFTVEIVDPNPLLTGSFVHMFDWDGDGDDDSKYDGVLLKRYTVVRLFTATTFPTTTTVRVTAYNNNPNQNSVTTIGSATAQVTVTPAPPTPSPGGGAQAPTVTSTSPSNQQTNVQAFANLVITFSEPMDPTQVLVRETTLAPITIFPGSPGQWSSDFTRLTITPTGPGWAAPSYTLQIVGRNQFQDQMTPYTFSFTTQQSSGGSTNQAPTAAIFTNTNTVSIDQSIQFFGSQSSDPEDCPSGDVNRNCLTYLWQNDLYQANLIGWNPILPIPNNAAYAGRTVTVTLVVRDSQGSLSPAVSKQIVINA